MDPNLPEPTPGQPLTPAPQPTPNGQSPKKMSKGMIFTIVGGVLFVILVVIGIVAAASMIEKNNTDKKNNDQSSKADDSSKEDVTANNPTSKPVTAKMLVELQTVCAGGSVTNAAPFTKPYRYVIFEDNNARSNSSAARAKMESLQPYDLKYDWDLFTVGTNDTSIELDDRSAPSEFNVVVCLDRDESTAVKTTTCELLRSSGMEEGASTVADYHSVKYKVKLYEAQSGKKIKELEPINGPATECPRVGYYSPENPDIYGDPDITELDARLEAFDK